MKKILMKRVCVALAALVLASAAASATNINISLDGYCDTFELTLTGTPKVYLDGIHSTNGCGLPSVVVGGFEHTIPTTGTAWFDLSDPSYGYIAQLPYGLEFLTNADTKRPCVWAFYLDYAYGIDVLVSSGTCTYYNSSEDRPNIQGKTPAWQRATAEN